MTKRQSEVLEFITEFISDKGYSPTLRQIGDGVGLSSFASIHKHLKSLERLGHIVRDYNRAASIRLTGACPHCGRGKRKAKDFTQRSTRNTVEIYRKESSVMKLPVADVL